MFHRQALGGYLRAAQAVLVCVDAAEEDAPKEAEALEAVGGW